VMVGPAVAANDEWPILTTEAEGLISPLQEDWEIEQCKKILVARGVTKMRHGRTPILILNLSSGTMELPQGMVVAEFRPVEFQERAGTEGPISIETGGAKNVEEPARHEKQVVHALGREDGQGLTPVQLRELRELVAEFSDVFMRKGAEMPAARVPPYHLELRGEAARPHRVPPAAAKWSYGERKEIQQEIQRLVQLQILEPSRSAWASRLAPVRKLDGTLRLVVDYRVLNTHLAEDHWPAPPPTQILQDVSRLTGPPRYFTTLDIADAFLRLPLAVSSRRLTAFRGPQGVYQWTRVPFGISVAPAAWQRTIDLILAGIPHTVPFVDDLLVVTATWEEHLLALRQILMALRRARLQLRPEKCAFARERVCYLGTIITCDGIKPDPAKTEAINEYPVPKNSRELKSFLGLAGFVRRWIPRFSIRAAALTELLRQAVPWNWGDRQVAAFEDLRSAIGSEALLHHPNFGEGAEPFELSVDSAKSGTGAILTQGRRPVAYFSRAFTPQQGRLAAGELEFLGVVLAVEHFRPYLWRRGKTKVWCDHKNILPYLMAPPNDKIQRWAARLADYDLEFHYRPSEKQAAVDALSRAPVLPPAPVFATTRSMARIDDEGKHIVGLPEVESKEALRADQRQTEELKAAQEQDPCLQALRALVINDPNALAALRVDKKHMDHARLLMARYSFRVDEDVLVREFTLRGDDTPTKQVVIPDVGELREQAMTLVHDRLGHRGYKKCVRVLAERVWWPTAQSDLKRYIASCHVCQQQQPRAVNAGLMRHLPLVEKPFTFICIDFVGPLPPTQRGNCYILVMLDLASRWVAAYATPDATSEQVQHVLLNWIAEHGVPRTIHSDNGAAFISEGIRLAYSRLGIRRSLTAPYRPQADPAEGAVKAVVRSLRALLLDPSNGASSKNWDEYLDMALFALRATPSAATGVSPFKYVYGTGMRLPLDLVLGRGPEQQPVSSLQELPDRLRMLRQRVLEFNADLQERSEAAYNSRHYDRAFEKGDEVLVYNMPVQGKFEARWSGPVVVHRVYDNRVSYLVGDPYNIENRLVHVSRLAPYYRRVHGPRAAAPVEEYPQLPLQGAQRSAQDGEASPVEQAHEENKDEAVREWPIRQLMGRRSRGGRREYLVEWEGPYAASWEPADALPADYRTVYDEYLGRR
jgi:transposase InsO family protein